MANIIRPKQYALAVTSDFVSTPGYNSYEKDEFGRVEISLHGRYSKTTLSPGAYSYANLPVGFRPKTNRTDCAVVYNTVGNGIPSSISVSPDGAITLNVFGTITGEIYLTSSTRFWD